MVWYILVLVLIMNNCSAKYKIGQLKQHNKLELKLNG